MVVVTRSIGIKGSVALWRATLVPGSRYALQGLRQQRHSAKRLSRKWSTAMSVAILAQVFLWTAVRTDTENTCNSRARLMPSRGPESQQRLVKRWTHQLINSIQWHFRVLLGLPVDPAQHPLPDHIISTWAENYLEFHPEPTYSPLTSEDESEQ